MRMDRALTTFCGGSHAFLKFEDDSPVHEPGTTMSWQLYLLLVAVIQGATSIKKGSRQ